MGTETYFQTYSNDVDILFEIMNTNHNLFNQKFEILVD